MLSAITTASLSGTSQLLTLCLTGAYLSHRRILTPTITRSLSSSIYHAFLPALLFTSTFSLPSTQSSRSTLSLLVPPAWGLLTMFVSALTSLPAALLTRPPVRRTVFVALLLGNANNLPLLLLHTLCDELPLQENCHARADHYVALFLAAWNTLMWTVVLQFLCNTPDDASPPGDVVTVHTAQPQGVIMGSSRANSASSGVGFGLGIWKVFSPPFLAIVTGGALGYSKPLSGLINTYLPAFLAALKLLAAVVVPMSSIIIGARLHSYKYQQPNKRSPLTGFSIFLAVFTRFVLLPMVGRQIFSFLDVSSFVSDPVLRIYLLIPYFMPTASNSVVMVQMAATYVPNVGERMEAALLVIIFWQYLLAPVFLTVNMAVGLGIVQESGGFEEIAN